MFYPRLMKNRVSRRTVSAFYGYDHRLKNREGSFYDTENLTNEDFPLLSTRRKRSLAAELEAPQGMIEKDALAYIDGGRLWYNGSATGISDLSPGEKQLVSMGAYIVIFPDKVYYNTADGSDFGSLEAEWSYSGRVEYSLCDSSGEEYPDVQYGGAAPEKPAEGNYWVNSDEGCLCRWSETEAMWIGIDTVYMKLSFTSEGQLPAQFSQYDGVEIEGARYPGLNGSKIIYAIGGTAADDSGGGESDWIVLMNEPSPGCTDENVNITIKRKVPDMDYVCECRNRLWGCFYGNDGRKNLNELYASALGDFKNWNQFMGLSTDSWRASVGSDGVWTGAAGYLGSPIFFKENRLHRISVSPGGGHQVSETPCRGVQKGSGRSLAVVNETLFYKSRDGVCAYQGGFPQTVSAALGGEQYSSAAAGAFGGKYYISMKNRRDEWNLFVYDAEKGLWMREDDLKADCFVPLDDELYCLSGKKLIALRGTEGEKEGELRWRAETGMLCCEYPGQKYLSRLKIRARMEPDAEMELSIEYDSGGSWDYAGRVRLKKAGSVEIPLRLRRCDHLRLRLEGRGEMKLLSVTGELTAC